VPEVGRRSGSSVRQYDQRGKTGHSSRSRSELPAFPCAGRPAGTVAEWPAAREHRRRGGAGQQRLRTGVAAEVNPARSGVAAQPHRLCRRGDRAHGGKRAHRGKRRQPPHARAGAMGQQHGDRGHHQRPHQVVLLLDAEGPGVLQRGRGTSLGEVVRLRRGEAPVRDPAECREGVVAQAADRVRREEAPPQCHRGDQDRQRRQQPASAPRPERPQVHPARTPMLVQQQRGDEEAAQYEEDVHADEPAGQAWHSSVVGQDGKHREGAHAVERGNPAATSPRWTIGSGQCGRASHHGRLPQCLVAGRPVTHASGVAAFQQRPRYRQRPSCHCTVARKAAARAV